MKEYAHAALIPIHGGARKTLVYILGVNRSGDLSRRLILLGGMKTEHVLNQLDTCARRAARVAPGANPVCQTWRQPFIPTSRIVLPSGLHNPGSLTSSGHPRQLPPLR